MLMLCMIDLPAHAVGFKGLRFTLQSHRTFGVSLLLLSMQRGAQGCSAMQQYNVQSRVHPVSSSSMQA